jgi:hypothetical protein
LIASTASAFGSASTAFSAIGAGVADDVHRVVLGPGGRQRATERRQRLRRELGDAAAAGRQRVDRQDAGPAAVADDREPVTGHPEAGCEGGHRIEQLTQLEHPQHARAPEGRIVDRIGAGQRPGVRKRRPRPGRAAPGLDHRHRLRATYGAGRRHELARIGDALDVKHHRRGRLVEREEIQHVAEVDVGHIAQRDDAREAVAASARPIERRSGDRAGLGDQGDWPGLRGQLGEAGVDAARRRDHAEAVGTDDAQRGGPRGVQHLLAQVRARAARFAKTGADDHRGAAAHPGQLRHEAGDGRRRRCDHRQLRRDRQLGDRRVGQRRADRSLVRIDRHHRALETALGQIAGQHRADRAGRVAGADQRDGAGREQGVEVAGGHRPAGLVAEQQIRIVL